MRAGITSKEEASEKAGENMAQSSLFLTHCPSSLARSEDILPLKFLLSEFLPTAQPGLSGWWKKFPELLVPSQLNLILY